LNVGTATTGYKACIVDRTIMQGEGVDDQLSAGLFTTAQPFSIYTAANRFTPTGGTDYLFDLGQNKVVIYGSPSQFYCGNVVAITTDVANSRLGLFKMVANTTSSVIGTNTNTEQTGVNLGAFNGTSLALFGSNPTQSVNANAIINTFILCNGANNSTQRTAISKK